MLDTNHFQLISASFSKDTAIAKGFATIADIQLYWKNCEDVYLRSTSSGHYKNLVEPLSAVYSAILEYQMRAICHLSKKQLSRAWDKLSEQVEWAGKEADILQASNRCKDHIVPLRQNEIQENFIVEMQKLDRICQAGADIAETIKNETENTRVLKMLTSLKSAAGTYVDGMQFNKDPVAGTCEWLYRDDSLCRWRDSSGSGVFWITAGPGCGKSVLARSLIVNGHLGGTTIAVDYGNSPAIQSTETIVCFFFFKDESSVRSSLRSAISAVLHRLFSKSTALARLLLPTFESGEGEPGKRDLSALWSILLKSAKMANCDIVCVLDALDECNDSERGRFIQWLDELYADDLVSSSTRLKFLITSRPYHGIEKIFEHQSRVQYFRFNADERHMERSHDISLVIDRKVADFASQFSQRDRDIIARRLKSQGTKTYLWLHLTLGIIESDPTEYSRRRDIEVLLSDIPSEVSEAYEKILGRSKNENRTSLLLQIILAAREPLSLDEANQALALAEASFEDGEILSHAQLQELCFGPNFETIAKNLCGLLINVYDGKISFIHSTAREFLVGHGKPASPPTGRWGLRFADAAVLQRVMARCCMQYLLLCDFKSRILFKFEIESETFRFLRYAAKNWPLHFEALDDDAVARNLPLARQLCSTSLLPWHTWGRVYLNSGSVEGLRNYEITSGWADLCVASISGLARVVEALLLDGVDVNQACERYPSALHAAIAHNEELVVALLLAHGAKVDGVSKSLGTPLESAVADQEHPGITKMLVDNGADPLTKLTRRRGGGSNTILGYAATLSTTDIFYTLLKSRPNLNTPETIISFVKKMERIGSTRQCLGLILDLVDDKSLGDALTPWFFKCLLSLPSTAGRALYLCRNKSWQPSTLIRPSVLEDIQCNTDGQDFAEAQEMLQQLAAQGRMKVKQITYVLGTVAVIFGPETLRVFIQHSSGDYDIGSVFSAAVCNRLYYDTMPLVVLEFAQDAISLDEQLQEQMLVCPRTEEWEHLVWLTESDDDAVCETEQKIGTVATLLSLPRHTDRVKKCIISVALQCSVHASSPVLKRKADALLGAALNRFNQQSLFDAKLLSDAAEFCDLSTLQLIFNYSSGVSMADELILKAVALNRVHGREIMTFLLQRYESEAVITPELFDIAVPNRSVFALLVDMHVERIEVTVDALVSIRDRHVLDTIIQHKRDQVAAIASAALHNAACPYEGFDPRDGLLVYHNVEAVDVMLNCCPRSWFEPTEKLVLGLLDAYKLIEVYDKAVAYVALLFEKLGDRIVVTESILLKAALSPVCNRLLHIFKLWKPRGLVLTDRLREELLGRHCLDELASVADCCGYPRREVRDGKGWHSIEYGDDGAIMSRETHHCAAGYTWEHHNSHDCSDLESTT